MREDFSVCCYPATDNTHERSLPVSQNIVPPSSKHLEKVGPNCGKVMGHAGSLFLGAMARTGSPLIHSLAETISEGKTSKKGHQAQISGWLARYDFAGPIATWLWNAATATIARDTVIALDEGSLSKEFGGNGMAHSPPRLLGLILPVCRPLASDLASSIRNPYSQNPG